MMQNKTIINQEEIDLASCEVGDNVSNCDSTPPCPVNYGSGSLQRTDVGTVSTIEISLNIPKNSVEKEEKFGHRRVHVDGGVSYKKISSSVIIDSVRIGIQKSVGSMALNPDRDVLMKDFMTVESTTYTATEAESNTSVGKLSFVFKTYAPVAFRHFRDLFGIKPEYFVSSFCSSPLVELANPGASGSLLYLTKDDEFILKTVQHKEANFLQKLLPGYYLNLNQNPCTLLPKFFGLYCCQRDSKNVRLVAMNNVLPSWMKIHQKYDLKGSTYNRFASKRELEKNFPTFKDLDFVKHHPKGIFLESEMHNNIMKTIQRDCRVLESFQIIDYSLLLGVHNLDLAKSENLQIRGIEDRNQELSMDSGDGNKHLHQAENKINLVPDQASSTNKTNNIKKVVEDKGVIKRTETNTDLRGIPARQANGDQLLLFVGIIDILQSYSLPKKIEHLWKSVILDGNSVSVHNPGFYAHRFQEFMSKSVFKPIPSSQKNNKKKSVLKLKPEEKNPNYSSSP